MDHFQTRWGRPRDDVYGAYDHQVSHANNQSSMPKVHTQQPTVTGTSVIAIKFDKGVMMAADNLASYGSLARFTDQERLMKVGDETVVGVSGDISDLQYISELLERFEIREANAQDNHTLRSRHVYKYLSRVMYNRRSKLDPLWNAILVAGLEDGKPQLSYVDLMGTTYSAPALATGFGAHLAIPLLRQKVDTDEDAQNLTEAQAREIIDECMKVLFYRDARSLDKYSVGTVKSVDGKVGVNIEQNVRCENMNWTFAKDIRGYGTQRV